MTDKLTKVFRYRLNLNKTQQKKIDQILSDCNFVYNYLLKEHKERDKNKQRQLTEFELIKSTTQIRNNNPFLKEVNSNVLQNVARRIHKVWKNYLAKLKAGGKSGHPRFKPIHRYNSFTYPHPIEKNGCGYKLDNSPLLKKKETRKL